MHCKSSPGSLGRLISKLLDASKDGCLSQAESDVEEKQDSKENNRSRKRKVHAFWLPGAGSDLTCGWGDEQLHRFDLIKWGGVEPQASGPLGQPLRHLPTPGESHPQGLPKGATLHTDIHANESMGHTVSMNSCCYSAAPWTLRGVRLACKNAASILKAITKLS
ncbi:TPA: hypothetical protein ACH3X2_012005 [Trebouxia sp. C0005]